MKIYEANAWGSYIKEIEATSETPSSYCVDGRKRLKETKNTKLVPTRDEAIAYIRSYIEEEINKAKATIEFYEGKWRTFIEEENGKEG